jgi:alkaline phosphatase
MRLWLLAILVTGLATLTRGETGNVIFIHPDGAGAGTWAAARALYVGPDNDLEWDRLPEIAVYRGHMLDHLTASSNGGATAHAFGIRPFRSAFGQDRGGEDGREPVDFRGESLSVAKQAIRNDIAVGLVQSGSAIEPGTAAFVSSVRARKDHEEIVGKLVESGAEVMLSGGEEWFLPEGEQGVYTVGKRTDGRDLLQEARDAGYVVVQTREELARLPRDATKVLGVFSESATFNDQPEERLQEQGLPLFDVGAPTLAEMTEVAIEVLSRNGQQFLLVVEEEGTDNFGNNNNASGTLFSAKRADDAIGVCRSFLRDNPKTLLVTTADSDGGGLRMVGMAVEEDGSMPSNVPEKNPGGGTFDGIDGTGGRPFIAQPDRSGKRLPFAVAWASGWDVSGGVLVRAEGFNSHLVRGSMDNTDIALLMRRTLFGGEVPTTRPVE